MKRFYIEYTPIRRGLTGREYLGQYIDENFSSTKFYPVFSNGFIEFGYIEGDDEMICNVLSFCEKIYAMKRLFVDEFRGAAKLYWIYIPPAGEPEKTVEDLFIEHSIEASISLLNDAKAYKIKMLKETVKKEFRDYNDIVANIAKEILLLEEYRSLLSEAQTTRLDAALTSMKNIYDVESCLAALEEDVEILNTYMPDYYSTKTEISDALDFDALDNINIVCS